MPNRNSIGKHWGFTQVLGFANTQFRCLCGLDTTMARATPTARRGKNPAPRRAAYAEARSKAAPFQHMAQPLSRKMVMRNSKQKTNEETLRFHSGSGHSTHTLHMSLLCRYNNGTSCAHSAAPPQKTKKKTHRAEPRTRQKTALHAVNGAATMQKTGKAQFRMDNH